MTLNPDDVQRPARPKMFEYRLPGDYRVLAGRTDSDNDQLSLKLARPDDWWFHVRGMPGSHVVLQTKSGQAPDRETLKRAAAIAAWHSKARGGGVVAVSGTQARFVTKPKGAKPGTVQIRKEQVFKVRPALPQISAQEPDEPQ
jgi:predicted ribosome quality control (RQC) complex YloA/Tae2 family protein